MLQARKPSYWGSRYDISVDGHPLATWDRSLWRNGGALELDRRRYEIRGNLWGSWYGMVTGDGAVVAAADRVGRKHWTVDADGRTYEFRRASLWRQEEHLYSGGQVVGSVKRLGRWRADTVADLPGLSLPVQVFVLAVVLTKWDWDSAVAASAVGGGAIAASG